MRAKRYTGKWRQLDLFAVENQPAPLPMAECTYHGNGAICDRCPERYSTDAHGFPHQRHERGPNHPKNAGPKAAHLLRALLRVCRSCDEAKTWSQWDRHRAECLACSGGEVKHEP